MVRVPDKMTHCFQPADQFVIKNLKEKMNLAFNSYIRLVRANYENNEAVQQIYANSAPQLRKVKYELLRQAIDNTPTAVILKSWEETGILRESFGIPTARNIPYDAFCAEANSGIFVIDEETVVDDEVVDDEVVDVDDSSDDGDDDEKVADDIVLDTLLPGPKVIPHWTHPKQSAS
jgi:hypothetical protein